MIRLRGPEFLPTTCSQVAQQFAGHLVLPPSLGATKYLHVDMLIHGRFYKCKDLKLPIKKTNHLQ